jgi:hypothetical protein
VKLLGISFQINLDSNDMVVRTRNKRISGNAHQSYVDVNTLQALAVGNGPTVIPAVNDLSWHTELGFSLFTTYHARGNDSRVVIFCPAEGVLNTATSTALTPGVISDSRATVETIKAFEVNRILYREYVEVDLWVRNGLDLVKKETKAGDFKYSCSTTRYFREDMLP